MEAPIAVVLDGLDVEQAKGLSEEAASFLDLMRRELRELQLKTAKSEVELKETRTSFGSTIQMCMAQGMAQLQTVKSSSEHGQQDQSIRLTEALARLEQVQLAGQRESEAQLRTLQRDFVFGLEGEKRERELALGKIEVSLSHQRQQSLYALASEKDSANSLDSKMQLQGSIDSLDQRLRADINQQHSIVQDQIRQQHNSMRERLSKHDEFRVEVQALLERTGRELRAEISRAGDDQKTALTQLRETVNAHKASSDKHVAEQRGANEQSKVLFRDAVQDLDRELRKEISRQAAAQQSVLSSQRGQLDPRHPEQVPGPGVLDALDQRVREMAQSYADLQDRLEQQRDSATLRFADHDQACAGLRTSLDSLARELQVEGGRVQHVADDQKALLEKLSSFQVAHAAQVAAHDGARSDCQASMLELERQLRSDCTRMGTEQQASKAESGSILSEHKLEIDRRLAAEKAWRDEQRNSLLESTDAMEKSLRKELQRLAGDAGEAQVSMREALDRQKAAVEKQMASERLAREEARDTLAGQCRDLERALRKEFGQLAEDQLGTLAKFRDLLSESKAENKGAIQAALEELDDRAKRDTARAAGEQRTANLRFAEQLQEQRVALDQHVSSQAHRHLAREDSLWKRSSEDGLQVNAERQLRKELGQLVADHATEQQAVREMIVDVRKEHEKALASERAARSEQHVALFESASASEQQVRLQSSKASEANTGLQEEVKELRRHLHDHRGECRSQAAAAEASLGDLRREGARLAEEHGRLGQQESGRALAVLSSRQERLEQAFEDHRSGIEKQLSGHQDLTRAALQTERPLWSHHQAPADQTMLDERVAAVERTAADSSRLLSALSSKQQLDSSSQQELHAQQMLSLEKHVTTRNESLKELIQKERMERCRDSGSLQERLIAVESRFENAVNAVSEQKQQALGLPGVEKRSPAPQNLSRELLGEATPGSLRTSTVVVESTWSRRPPSHPTLAEATSITSRPPPSADTASSLLRPPRPLDGTPVSLLRSEALPLSSAVGDGTPVIHSQRQQSPNVRFPPSLAGSFTVPVDRHERPATQDRAEVLVVEMRQQSPRRPTMAEQFWQPELRPHGSAPVDEIFIVGDATPTTTPTMRTSTVAGEATPGSLRTSTAVMPGTLVSGPPSLYARTSTPARLGASPLRVRA